MWWGGVGVVRLVVFQEGSRVGCRGVGVAPSMCLWSFSLGRLGLVLVLVVWWLGRLGRFALELITEERGS